MSRRPFFARCHWRFARCVFLVLAYDRTSPSPHIRRLNGQLNSSGKHFRGAAGNWNNPGSIRERLLRLGRENPALHTRVAAMLQAYGRYEQAEVYYRESLAMDFDQLGAVAGLASLLERARAEK